LILRSRHFFVVIHPRDAGWSSEGGAERLESFARGADRLPAPARCGRWAPAVPDDAVFRDPGPGGSGLRGDDHSLPRESQPPDLRRPLPGCRRLRGSRYLPDLARRASADARRHRVAPGGGMMIRWRGVVLWRRAVLQRLPVTLRHRSWSDAIPVSAGAGDHHGDVSLVAALRHCHSARWLGAKGLAAHGVVQAVVQLDAADPLLTLELAGSL
jgi:hypothetical protein